MTVGTAFDSRLQQNLKRYQMVVESSDLDVNVYAGNELWEEIQMDQVKHAPVGLVLFARPHSWSFADLPCTTTRS
jgi:hypothetical protein